MSARSETRLPIRFCNGISSIFGKHSSSQFVPEQLLEKAARKNRLSDFGEEFFLEGLQVLCDALNTESNLHFLGRLLAKEIFLSALRNRLELSAYWKQYPEALKAAIVRPVFIVGLPRTGTTLLFNLLALDDRFRYLRGWEAVRPGPSYHSKKNVSKAIAERNANTNFFLYLKPDLKKIHFTTPKMPEECIALFINSFECDFFSLHFKTDSYFDWFFEHDHGQSYAYYRNQLKWLQRQADGRRWLLKAPSHLFAFETLFKTFPDALVIQTHRDPVNIVPSVSSLMYNFQSATTYDVAKKNIGLDTVELLSKTMRDMLRLRDGKGYNVMDVYYEDLISDPIKTLQTIYQHMGETLSDAMQARVGAYLTQNPKNKYGRHKYTLDEYGVTREMIHTEFDFYYHSFNFGGQ